MLIREFDETKVVNELGARLQKHYQLEFPGKKITPQQIVKAITSIDPTPNKDMSFWVALTYARFDKASNTFNGMNKFEDIGRAFDALEKFRILLRKPNLTPPLPIRDVNQITSLPALEKIVNSYKPEDLVSNKSKNTEISDVTEANFYKSGQAKLVANTSKIKVVIPKTEEASKWFGMGTTWCTAAKNNNRFAQYNKKGPLYIIMIRGTPEKYQFHFESEQFMDSSDKPIDVIELLKKYPDLARIFLPGEGDLSTRMAKSDKEYFHLLAAKNPNCPGEALEILSRDANNNVRYWVASNPNCPGEALEFLSRDDNYVVRHYVAMNPNCPGNILEFLSSDKEVDVRREVAMNPNCPGEALEILYRDEHYAVRYYVARNQNCPIDILEILSRDKDANVRSNVAQNPNCPGEALEILYRDEDYYVRRGVAENPNCPIYILEILSRDESADVRCSVANNPNCPIYILEILSRDEDYLVRRRVAENPNCPIYILEILSRDANDGVRTATKANPNYKKR